MVATLLRLWGPFGVLLFFIYRAFFPAEINVSQVLEMHQTDLIAAGISGLILLIQSISVASGSKALPKPAEPKAVEISKPSVLAKFWAWLVDFLKQLAEAQRNKNTVPTPAPEPAPVEPVPAPVQSAPRRKLS